MSLIIWSVAFFLLGFVVYLVGPLLVAPALPYRWRRRFANMYWKQAVVTADRPQVVERKHGGYTLIATNFKPAWGEEGAIDSKTGHWRDDAGLMGRLFERPIGFIPESYNVITDAKHAHLGKAHMRWAEDGHHRQTLSTDGGQIQGFNPYTQVPKTPTLVELHDVKGVLGGQADSQLGEVAYDFAEKSQAKLGSRSVIEIMSFIMAYAAAFGLFWFFSSQGAGGAGISSVSIFLGVV